MRSGETERVKALERLLLFLRRVRFASRGGTESSIVDTSVNRGKECERNRLCWKGESCRSE